MAHRRLNLSVCLASSAIGAILAAGSARAASSVPIDARAYGVTCNGTTDDTTALAAALATGLDVQLPNGTCKYATLTIGAGHNGQTIRGAGAPTTSGGPGTTLKPTGGTAGITISGTASPLAFVIGVGVENLSIDTTNLADTSSSAAILQTYAFDVRYANVRQLNGGAHRRALQMLSGAYTTQAVKLSGNVLEMYGVPASPGGDPTTLTCVNCDFLAVNVNYAASLKMVGGAIQPAYYKLLGGVIYLAPGTTPTNYPTANTAGLYAAVVSSLTNSQNVSLDTTDIETQGSYPSTYNDGTHGTLPLVAVVYIGSTAVNNVFASNVWGGLYPLDLSNTSVFGNIGTSGTIYDETVTHNRPTLINNGQALYCFSDLGTTRTCLIDASNGNFVFAGGYVRPATSGTNFFKVMAADGTEFFDWNSGTTGSDSTAFLTSGAKFACYSVTYTQTCYLNGATGDLTLNAGLSAASAVISGQLAAATVKTATTTVAGLPSAATAGAGARAFVTDATACTFAATPTGGGAAKCPVYSDGAAWKEG